MDFETILYNLKTQRISLFLFIVVLLILFSVIFFLGSLTYRFSRRIKDLTKRRFGFGGKPLFSFLILLLILGAIPLTLYASNESISYVNYARAEKEIYLQVDSVQLEKGFHSVYFMAVPIINDSPWGDREYKVAWDISGTVSLSKVEKNKSIDNPSYFEKKLPSGSYVVEVVIEGEQFSMKKSQEFVLE